ncbi:hypothetical protein KW868_14695 [Acinetobacter guillouiae]|uniref:Uncharacterized protein n=1 Tax=Acinetobacter guillouiae TaxID=106649 RepID=A0A8X8GML4_ACIGI|nr:hypothetical protein [Acinetobacter guillouiae]MCF0265693.1 hypothetical protein [Acinetobacter guillouiae]
MKALNELKRHIKAYKSYQIQDLNDSLHSNQFDVKKAIYEDDLFVTELIRIMGSFYAQRAFYAIENDFLNSDALRDLNLAFMYMEACNESELMKFKKNSHDRMKIHRFKKHYSEISALLFWAILTENFNLAKKLAKFVSFCLEQKIIQDFPNSYDYFSLWVYSKWSKELPLIDLDLKGEFKFLIDHWNESGPNVAETLMKICDLHCEELIDNDKRKFPPKLVCAPFTIIPLEIHVINKLRLLDGLDEIEVNHPLMQTNAAKIKSFEVIEDELLEEFQLKILF